MEKKQRQRRIALLFLALLLALPMLSIEVIAAQNGVIQPINIPTPAGTSSFTYTVSGCYVDPTSGTSGTTVNFNAIASCVLTVTLPTPGSTSRIVFSGGASTTTVTTCASGTCSTFSPPDWLQYYSTFNLPITGGSSSQSISVYGTQTGTSAIICSAVAGSSCSGWTDYGTVVYPEAGLGTSSQQVSASPLTYGLAGYWPLSEATSGTCTGSVFDLSGNGNTGTCQNSPTYTSGPWSGSGALSSNSQFQGFESPSGSVNIQNSGVSYTLSVWVYLNSFGGSYTEVIGVGGANTPLLQLQLQPNQEIAANWFAYDSTNNSVYYSRAVGSILNTGQWYHVVGVFTATTNSQYTLSIYVNGQLANTQTLTLSGYVLYSTAMTGYNRIVSNTADGSGPSGSAYALNGAIADVRFYNYALTPSEVAQLYQQRPPQLEYTVTSSATYNFNYYLQDSVNASYSVTGGGTGYSSPSISLTSLGQQLSNLYTLSSTPSEFWVDNSTSISVTNPLAGSSSTEGWFTSMTPYAVSTPTSVSFAYYNQYVISPSQTGPPSGSNVFCLSTTAQTLNFTWQNSTMITYSNSADPNYYFWGFPSGTNVIILNPDSTLLALVVLTTNGQAWTPPPGLQVGSSMCIYVGNSAPSAFTRLNQVGSGILTPFALAVGGPDILITIFYSAIVAAIYMRTRSASFTIVVLLVSAPPVAASLATQIRLLYVIGIGVGLGALVYTLIKREEYS